MAEFSRILRKIKATNFHSHFAVELLLLLVLGFSVGANLFFRMNSASAEGGNQSLFFDYLAKHPGINEKLVDAYETVDLRLSENPNILPKQILAASTAINPGTNSATPASATVPLPTLSGSVLLKPNPASNNPLVTNRDIQVYQVRGGDTLAQIAASYGISVDTILWENNLASANTIHPGQELKILPVSGVEHTVQKGETVFSIAKQYGVDPGEILDYNNIEIADFIQVGDQLLIPNGVKQTPATPQRQQYLADLQREDYQKVAVPADFQGSSTNFIWPEPAGRKLSQGFSPRHPAVDIPCRDCAVVAAADGIVEIAGWQGGYGYTILLNHGNGVTTRYGHASKLLVTAGQHVTQGQEIMISGSTGNSTGPHLHFEIIFNGKAANPLNYVHP